MGWLLDEYDNERWYKEVKEAYKDATEETE